MASLCTAFQTFVKPERLASPRLGAPALDHGFLPWLNYLWFGKDFAEKNIS